MKYTLPAFAALATVAVLAGCEQNATTPATTVVPVIKTETTREVIVQPAAAPAQPATETTQTTTRSRETPYGTATKTETTTTRTTP